VLRVVQIARYEHILVKKHDPLVVNRKLISSVDISNAIADETGIRVDRQLLGKSSVQKRNSQRLVALGRYCGS